MLVLEIPFTSASDNADAMRQAEAIRGEVSQKDSRREQVIYKMTQSGTTTKSIRVMHRYLGLFFAPAIVFFALSGALQTFGWHETARDGSYTPPGWLVRMAQLHKKQTMSIPHAKNKGMKAPAEAPEAAKNSSDRGGMKSVLKYFVFTMSLALMLTTVLGVLMALRYGGERRIVWMTIALGTVFPIAVVLITRP